jgi:hypothetical protein
MMNGGETTGGRLITTKNVHDKSTASDNNPRLLSAAELLDSGQPLNRMRRVVLMRYWVYG